MSVKGRRYSHAVTTGFLAVVALVLAFSMHAWTEDLDESVLKAAFLNYFVALIRWPDDDHSPDLTFCTPGENATSRSLQELLRSSRPGGVRVDFRLIATPVDVLRCDYVFIDAYNNNYALPIIAASRGRPILTVSDIEGFAVAGGVIELRRDESRIAVVINEESLKVQGLGASSKLLALAIRIPGK